MLRNTLPCEVHMAPSLPTDVNWRTGFWNGSLEEAEPTIPSDTWFYYSTNPLCCFYYFIVLSCWLLQSPLVEDEWDGKLYIRIKEIWSILESLTYHINAKHWSMLRAAWTGDEFFGFCEQLLPVANCQPCTLWQEERNYFRLWTESVCSGWQVGPSGIGRDEDNFLFLSWSN